MAGELTPRQEAVLAVLRRFGPQQPLGVTQRTVPERAGVGSRDELPTRIDTAGRDLEALVEHGDARRLDTDPVRYESMPVAVEWEPVTREAPAP